MRARAIFVLSVAACGGPAGDGEFGPCRLEADPMVRVGRDLGLGFEPLSDREELEPFASPQGGFGLLLDVQTEGVGVGPDHEVLVEIVGELDGPGGDPVAGYHLDGALLMCDEDGPGHWGTILLTIDQTRFGSLDELDTLAGRDIVLHSEVADMDGNVATGLQTIRIRIPQ